MVTAIFSAGAAIFYFHGLVGFAYAFALPTMVSWNGMQLVNSATHMIGERKYDVSHGTVLDIQVVACHRGERRWGWGRSTAGGRSASLAGDAARLRDGLTLADRGVVAPGRRRQRV